MIGEPIILEEALGSEPFRKGNTGKLDVLDHDCFTASRDALSHTNIKTLVHELLYSPSEQSFEHEYMRNGG
jgi:hypothetical protein